MDDGPGRPRLAALLGRVLRARISSHLQVWIVATVGFVVSAAVFWLGYGGPRHDGTRFAILGLAWLGVGTGQSLVVQRRRDSVRVSEAKPFGRLPRS
jgi:4-amino-4-deoxy-L-arabinose transferase-like glycosyltransferase